MPIMRKQKVNRYTTVDNYLIDDKRLDPEGKGYLIYMLRKPDNWHFNYKSIQNDLNVGERNVRTNINRLRMKKDFMSIFILFMRFRLILTLKMDFIQMYGMKGWIVNAFKPIRI